MKDKKGYEIHYNPLTGKFTKVGFGKTKEAGYKTLNGHVKFEINGKVWSGINLAWYMVYGGEHLGRLKTLNGDNSDCRITNIVPVRPEHLWQKLERLKIMRQYIRDFKAGKFEIKMPPPSIKRRKVKMQTKTVYLSNEIIEEFYKASRKENLSFSALLQRVMEEYLINCKEFEEYV